jgi:2-oxoacid:acceptor oxidoreductase delta subunit (pyruvate/2-ketoisovalerate family)
MKFQTKYPGPWVDVDKNGLLTNNVGEWAYRNPEVDQSKCSHCGLCYLYCPTGCIVDKDSYFDADLTFCKGCGICANVCPAKAIAMITGGKS